MNKSELSRSIAQKTGLSKAKSNDVIDAITSSITESLIGGEKVTIVGFGTFTPYEREARKGRNPKTGEVIQIPSKKVVKFKSGSGLNF